MQVSPVPASDEVCAPVFSNCLLWDVLVVSPAVRSAGYKCLPFLLVMKCARLYFGIACYEMFSCVSSINLKCALVHHGVSVKRKKRRIICQSKYYDEESVKCLLEGILEGKREEREKREMKKFEERRLAREFELKSLRVQLSNKLNENELKAWNRINNLANVCILSENRTTEVSEPVNKCRPLINPVVNKSVENATSCDFEKKNCDSPVRWTNVSHPSEVKERRTKKNNLFKIVEGKEFKVYRNSDCEVKMKAGLCEGRVKAVAMGAQWVINPDNIGVGSFEFKRDKGVANPEGLILLCEGDTRNRWRDGQVCPDVGQGTMVPWAIRLGREKKDEKSRERTDGRRRRVNGKGERKSRRRKKRTKESGRERSPPCMEKRAESGIGVERR
ncbi:hypothetical protein TNCV_1993081 [Trichonephila clavipes]|nr:hypothetical protein TNCV_1993081 [Trichonephila clavipes]